MHGIAQSLPIVFRLVVKQLSDFFVCLAGDSNGIIKIYHLWNMQGEHSATRKKDSYFRPNIMPISSPQFNEFHVVQKRRPGDFENPKAIAIFFLRVFPSCPRAAPSCMNAFPTV